MISIFKLSEILKKISDDHHININLDDLKVSFPELNGISGKSENNINPTRCLALMSKGERCTRKPKCMKNGLCGIHLNMLEKNGSLPNGKFNEDNNNGASGQSSSNLVSVSDLESKSGKVNKSPQSSKSKKPIRKKIDKDVETDDSDAEEDDLTKKQPIKKTSDSSEINRNKLIKKPSKNANSSSSEEELEKEANNSRLETEIEHIIKEIVNESNYNKCKTFTKKVESILSTKLDQKPLSNSNSIKQLIKSRLESEFNFYDSKFKESMEEYKNNSSSEEEIECIKFKKDNKTYLLDEKTSIVYNIEEPHSEIGILKNDIIVYLD